jgi:MOSC domain-containing protein YiiM
MKLISVNVGLPREVRANGKLVRTGIFKAPVAGRVRVRALNLDGDAQADLVAHGGPYKAVYAYPGEHYDFWRRELGGADLPWGAFGENLTTDGLREDEVNIGDRFRIGTAELEVTQPRLPCFKLGIKFGDPTMVKRFLGSLRTGFYLRVAREGELGAGDAIERLHRDPGSVSVVDIVRLYAFERDNRELLRRVLALEALTPSWREHFQGQLADLAG